MQVKKPLVNNPAHPPHLTGPSRRAGLLPGGGGLSGVYGLEVAPVMSGMSLRFRQAITDLQRISGA